VLADLTGRAGLHSDLPAGLRGHELAVRGPYRFLVNRTANPLDLTGLPGRRLDDPGTVLVPRGVAVFHHDTGSR
jgi:beta-galactosidase